MPHIPLLVAATLAVSALFGAGEASAQTGGCTAIELTDPQRQGYDCGNGLVIEAEGGLILDLPPDAAPETVTVDGGAVLVDLPPDSGEFQIRTPHAIASVRGTVFVVDVGADTTSVFVAEGTVAVSRADGSETVPVQAGEGVDVAVGQAFQPQRWGAGRVASLLARFGR